MSPVVSNFAVTREGFTERVTSEQSLKESEGASQTAIWGENVPGRVSD